MVPWLSSPGNPESIESDFIRRTSPGVLWAGHAGMWVQCFAQGTYIGAFQMSGTQTITVEQWEKAVTVTAVPSLVRKNGNVTFTARRTDNGTLPYVDLWTYTKDPGQVGATPTCWNYNPCTGGVGGTGGVGASGWMKGRAVINGAYYVDSAHVTTYTTFTLDADRSAVYAGDTVTFTPKADGIAAPAARWRFVPDSTADTGACADGVMNCKKQMSVSGTMWAYTHPTSGLGDSASKRIEVLKFAPPGTPFSTIL